MENQNTNRSLFDLSFNENAKTQLRGAAVWAGIAAIFSLVSAALSFISAIMGRTSTRTEYKFEGFNQTRMSAEKSENIVSVVISLIITFLLFYFLNRFSSQTRAGLNSNNQQLVNNGLGNLSSYFVTIGILVIICLALFLFVIALSGGGIRY